MAIKKVAGSSFIAECNTIKNSIGRYTDWDINTMTAISMAESGCNASKNNLTSTETHIGYDGNVVCVGSYGALQVGCVHKLGDVASLNNLDVNVDVAHSVWLKQGYNSWTTYSNGKYLRYLR